MRGPLSGLDDPSIVEKLQRDSGIPLPPWLLGILSVAILIAGVVAIFKPIWPVGKSLLSRFSRVIARMRQDQRRAHRRGKFADYIDARMRRLGEKEEWRDSRYAELEAEVEIRPSERRRFRFLRPRAEEVRRVPSLSEALASVSDRVVVLEGDPGSGKSVALRHLTQFMAERVLRKPSETEPIALYVNLKEFSPESEVKAADVRALVFAAIARGRNRDIDRYLEDEFDRGVEEGSWLFLFDSFDEIPAVLSATDVGPVIEQYADAIYEFLHGLGSCRGIVASREFRGPSRRLSWPRFIVMPLSWERKIELVKKSDLPLDKEQELIEDLKSASTEMVSLSDNPMFLGLLCESIRDGNPFPHSAHAVIEDYVSERFERDRERLADLFAVDPRMVRSVAEELSFQIANHRDLGLSVGRALVVDLVKGCVDLTEDEVVACLDALEYTKLVRDQDGFEGAGDERQVTFAHRRLQEYFATCVVLRDPDRISAETVLTDGRWRETAVTVLQVQQSADAQDLLECATALLQSHAERARRSTRTAVTPFKWSPGEYHVLHILADGGGYSRYPASAATISGSVDSVLSAAWRTKNLMYRKWVLEVCSSATPQVALSFIRDAFRGTSGWLREEAYVQTRRVRQVSAEIESEIRQTMLDFSAGGELRRSYQAIKVQVRRLPNPVVMLNAIRLLCAVPIVEAVAAAGMLAVALYSPHFERTCAFPLFWLMLGFVVRMRFARPGGVKSKWLSIPRRVWIRSSSSAASLARRQRLAGKGYDGRFPLIGLTGMRISMVAAFPVVIGDDPVSAAVNITTFVVMLVSMWSYGALLAVRQGRWLSLTVCPLLVAFPVVVAAQFVATKKPVARFRELIGPFALVLAGLLIFGVFAAGLIFLISSYPRVMVVVAICLAAIIFFPLGFWMLRGLVLAYRDSRVMDARSLGSVQVVGVGWLAQKLCSVRSSLGVIVLLRNLRLMKTKLRWDDDAIELLRCLGEMARDLDADWAEGREVGRIKRRFVKRWSHAGIDRDFAFDIFKHVDVLDEIARTDDSLTRVSGS